LPTNKKHPLPTPIRTIEKYSANLATLLLTSPKSTSPSTASKTKWSKEELAKYRTHSKTKILNKTASI